MEHFLRVSFKYKENPFEYDDTAKIESSKLGSKKSSKSKTDIRAMQNRKISKRDCTIFWIF